MKKAILSTRKTDTKRTTAAIAMSIIMCIMGIVVIAFYVFAADYIFDNSMIFILFLGLFVIADGIVMIAINCFYAKTYIDIFEDRIEGKGLQGMSLMDFNIKMDRIVNISVENMFIYIHTASGKYKIRTSKDTATKVFSYLNQVCGKSA